MACGLKVKLVCSMQIWHPQFFFFSFFFKKKTVKENFYIKVGRMYRVEARRNRCTHFSELCLEERRRTRNREKKI
jgi:hypothetical protein